jgi:hypothetical protein
MLFLYILFSITSAKAAFSSFVIPGSGDLLLGDKKRGACFITAEAAIWLTYFDSNRQANKLDNRSRNFAAFYASANLGNQDKDYFDAMENYMTNIDYNETVKEYARRLYPDTTDAAAMQYRIEKRKEYIEENSYTGSDAWNWQSVKMEDDYRDIRKAMRKNKQKASHMIGFALANRTISLFTTYFFGERVAVKVKENEVEVGFHF